MKTVVKTICGAALAMGFSMPSLAQSADMSPVLLIESGPSDNVKYKRMIFTKYLVGSRVSSNYRAYNRSEFTQVPNTTPGDLIAACATGRATTLAEIQAFERTQARRERNGQSPEVVRFCIKNVPNWEAGAKKTWLDPIFNGMPYAASLNN